MHARTTLSAAFLLLLPSLAMATPSGDGPPPPTQADEQYRRDARKLMKYLYHANPAKFDALMDMRQNNPHEFRSVINKMLDEKKASGFDAQANDAENLKKRERRQDFRDALEDHLTARGKDKARTHNQLMELAEEIFDAKQEQRHVKINALQAEIERLEAEVTEHTANREALIEDFVAVKVRAAESRDR